jgi:hypothetical protein
MDKRPIEQAMGEPSREYARAYQDGFRAGVSEPLTGFNLYTSTPMANAEILAKLRKTRCNPFKNPACVPGVLCQCAIEDDAADLIERQQARIEELEKGAEVAHYELMRADHRANSTFKVLMEIHSAMNPPRFELNGKIMELSNPYANECLQAMSDYIRAIPERIAAINEARAALEKP